jgi:hypothetical protein
VFLPIHGDWHPISGAPHFKAPFYYKPIPGAWS